MARKRKTVEVTLALKDGTGVVTARMWLKKGEADALRRLRDTSLFKETSLSEWAASHATRHHRRRVRLMAGRYSDIKYIIRDECDGK